MISNTFEFVGKITPCKETENFHPYENIRFPDSDWGKKSIKFNVKCGNNRHLVEVSQLVYAKNPDSMMIYTFTKGSTSSDGVKTKGEKLEISFKDRFKQEIIDKVAEYKKFVVDIDEDQMYFFDEIKHNLDDKIVLIVPTKTGKHIITTPFNTLSFQQHFINKYGVSPDIKKNHLTLLYENL